MSRNLEGFSRFLHVAAASSGQSLDFSKLAQKSRVSRTSTLRYFEALVAARAYLPKGTRRIIVVPNSPPRKLESGVEVLGLADLLAAMAR